MLLNPAPRKPSTLNPKMQDLGTGIRFGITWNVHGN